VTTKSRAVATRTGVILVIVVVLVAAVGYSIVAYAYSYPPFCSGYPPGGDCPGNYSSTFTISVNYTGPWRLTYQGYASGGESNPTNVKGNLTGTGPYSRPVTLSGPDNNGLTLCATAEKLDGSSSTLTLTVTGSSETSVPYGSTSYCGGVYP
jgi:hypothetical protein